MKNKFQRFLVTAGLAVFVILISVKCMSNDTQFTTQMQPASAKIMVTIEGVPMEFALDTTTINGFTASGNISGTILAPKSTVRVTSMSFLGRLGSPKFDPPVNGVVGDQPVLVTVVNPVDTKKANP